MTRDAMPLPDARPAPRTRLWMAACAIVLIAVASLMLYKHYGHNSRNAISPLDPRPAEQQVAIHNESKKTQERSSIEPGAAPSTSSALDTLAGAAYAMEPAASDKSALPASPVSAAGTTPTPVVPAPSESEKLNARLDQLEKAIAGLTGLITKLSSDFTAWTLAPHRKSQTVAGLDPNTDTLISAPPKKRRKPVVHSPMPVAIATPPRTVPAPAPDVLSIDTWNGKASVVVRSGATVQFMTEGDKFGHYTLQRADRNGQRAVFTDGTDHLSVAADQSRNQDGSER